MFDEVEAREKGVSVGVRLPESLVEELDRIAKEKQATDRMWCARHSRRQSATTSTESRSVSARRRELGGKNARERPHEGNAHVPDYDATLD